MKKIFLVLLAFLIVSTSYKTLAQGTNKLGDLTCNNQNYESLSIIGDIDFNNLSISKSLHIVGDLKGHTFKSKSVNSVGGIEGEDFHIEELSSVGSIDGKNYYIKNLSIVGEVDVDNLNVTGEASFVGEVEITNGTLNTIEISTKASTFNNTQIKGRVFVKKNSSKEKHSENAQILELKGDTSIQGDVTFEVKGKIHLYDNAKILGHVINAEVIKM